MPDPLPVVAVDDTRTTNATVQRISDDQAKMAADIAAIKEALTTTPFARKICETIEESGSLKKCIRGIVWQTIREKAWALILAGIIFVCLLFAKEVSTYAVKYTARKTAEQIIDERIPPPSASSSSTR